MNNQKNRRLYFIIILICAVISIILVGELFYELIFLHRELPGFFSRMTTDKSSSFFTSHFTLGICLALIGVIALLMPKASKQRYSNNRSDDIMIIVSLLLFLCAIIAIVISFL